MAGFAPEVLAQLALQKGVGGGGGLSWGGLGGIIGDVYFVSFANGLNTNLGTPDSPFQTITYAMAQCQANHNDYIFVIDGPNAAPEVFPIVVRPVGVHIIGLTTPTEYVRVQPPADTEAFYIAATAPGGYQTELAGFDLSGGNTSPCLRLGNAFNVWIHDCIFGSILAGGTPQDGIRINWLNFAWSRIERCTFYGSSGAGKGTIARWGITNNHPGEAPGAKVLNGTEIRDCEFLSCLIGINLHNAQDVIIRNNAFVCCADAAAGEAITLTSSAGCLITENKACDEKDDMFNSPWADDGATNGWSANWNGTAEAMP